MPNIESLCKENIKPFMSLRCNSTKNVDNNISRILSLTLESETSQLCAWVSKLKFKTNTPSEHWREDKEKSK
jgi:hypothetical protein